MPSTACGFSLPLILWRMSASVSIASPPAASVSAIKAASRGWEARLKNRRSGRIPASRASVRILSPSARNSPSARRFFLSRSPRACLTRGLEKAVIWRGTSLLFVEQRLDQSAEPVDRLLGAEAGGADRDRVALGRAKHHQAHDRSAADLVAVLLDLDRGVDLRGDGDELGAGPGMEAA